MRRRPEFEARFITLSMKRPSFPVFGLTPIPNNNATHNMACTMLLKHATQCNATLACKHAMQHEQPNKANGMHNAKACNN